MSLVKQMIDDDVLAERMERGWDEVYYAEEWPSEQEREDDAQRYPVSEPVRPDREA